MGSVTITSPHSNTNTTLTLLKIFKDFQKDLTAFLSFRKRTMFQKIVDSMEGVPDEKEKINYISNNPTRKEIVM